MNCGHQLIAFNVLREVFFFPNWQMVMHAFYYKHQSYCLPAEFTNCTNLLRFAKYCSAADAGEKARQVLNPET